MGDGIDITAGELGRFQLGMEFYLDNTGEWHKITQVTHTAGSGTTINEYQYRCNDVVRIRYAVTVTYHGTK